MHALGVALHLTVSILEHDMAYQALITSLDAPVGLIEGYIYPDTRSLVMTRSRMSFLGVCPLS